MLFSLALASAHPLVLDGELTAGPPHFVLVDFEVPAGVAEIEVRHTSLTPGNVLDWGLQGPNGTRGWGGGNAEPAVVGELAASRSYLPGPIEPGTWQVVIGKARLQTAPYAYALEVELRDAPTLEPIPRSPYVPSPPLELGARWYAGDFHVHSSESGDAHASLDQIATLARSRGLDFVAITDHNVVSHLDLLVEAQARHPDVLLLPAMEFTTYAGHANLLGNTRSIDHKLGIGGVTVEGALAEAQDHGALVSINHPVLDLGGLCIGCAWEHEVDWTRVDAVEIGTGGLAPAGALFVERAIGFWEAASAQGHRIAAIGGSDDHRAGQNLGVTGSPIGDPTTLVWAEALSVEAILAGVRAGRTVVKLQGPEDPMVELSLDGPAARAVVSGGIGRSVRLLRDGAVWVERSIDADPFAIEAEVGWDARVRAEVWEGGLPRVVTSHQWSAEEAGPDPRCGCAAGAAPSGWSALIWGPFALVGLRWISTKRSGSGRGAASR